ncbi:MAG: hypothetical protein AABX47_01245 [Nanoarchaeota archaeon]
MVFIMTRLSKKEADALVKKLDEEGRYIKETLASMGIRLSGAEMVHESRRRSLTAKRF